jgi:hypothetical protein
MESLRSDTDSENRRTRRNVCLSDTSSTKSPTSAVTGRVIHGTAVHYRQNGLHTSRSTSTRRDIAYLLLYFYIRVEVRVWLRRLAAGLSPRRPGFATCSLDVGFVVEKVTLRTGFFSELFGFSLSVYHSAIAPHSSVTAPALVKRHIIIPSVLS